MFIELFPIVDYDLTAAIPGGFVGGVAPASLPAGSYSEYGWNAAAGFGSPADASRPYMQSGDVLTTIWGRENEYHGFEGQVKGRAHYSNPDENSITTT